MKDQSINDKDSIVTTCCIYLPPYSSLLCHLHITVASTRTLLGTQLSTSAMSGHKYLEYPEAQLVGLVASGSHKDAEVLYRSICKARKARYGKESSETYDDILRRALLLLLGSRYREAEESLYAVIGHRQDGMKRCKEEFVRYRDKLKHNEDNLEHYKRNSGYHKDTLEYHENNVKYYKDKVKFHKAKLEQSQERYLKSINALGEALAGQNKHDAAVDIYLDAFQHKDEYEGKARQEALVGVDSFAQLLARQGMLVKADAVGCLMVYEREKMLGRDHLDTLVGMYTLAGIKYKRQRYGEAVALYQSAYVGMRKHCGDAHADTIEFLADLEEARRAASAGSSWIEGFWSLLP
jgi:tetratricopeptide (TPR) repeat protein